MIRDNVAGFELPTDFLEQHFMETHALTSLGQGMNFLHGQVKQVEAIVRGRFEPGTGMFLMGNAEQFSGLSMPLITCSFHWYAVSCCNWLKLIGFLRNLLDPTSPRPREYLVSAAPEVLSFRDKVAAHFERVEKKGNHSEQMASIMPPLTFERDAFYVGGMRLSWTRGDVSTDSAKIQRWSLTKVHEALMERFGQQEMSAGPTGDSG